MALVIEFTKNAEYKIKQYGTDSNPFEKIEMEETERDSLGDEQGADLDLDGEDIIYLEDDVDISEADSEDIEDEQIDEWCFNVIVLNIYCMLYVNMMLCV